MVTEHTLATNIIDLVRQAYCGLHGHDDLLQFEQDRMFLKCASCGHESPGWEMSDTPPPRPRMRTEVEVPDWESGDDERRVA
jgi:hypothetical protein